MVANHEAVAVLPSGQVGLTAQARKRIRQRINRKKSVEGRAMLKRQQQKRHKRSSKRHKTPHQKRKQLRLIQENTSCELAIPQLHPDTPPREICMKSDASPKRSGVSGSAAFVLPCSTFKETE